MGNQGECPVCGKSLDEKYEGAIFQDGDVFYFWECDCGVCGKEYYTMEFDGHFSVVKNGVEINV